MAVTLALTRALALTRTLSLAPALTLTLAPARRGMYFRTEPLQRYNSAASPEASPEVCSASEP